MEKTCPTCKKQFPKLYNESRKNWEIWCWGMEDVWQEVNVQCTGGLDLN